MSDLISPELKQQLEREKGDRQTRIGKIKAELGVDNIPLPQRKQNSKSIQELIKEHQK